MKPVLSLKNPAWYIIALGVFIFFITGTELARAGDQWDVALGASQSIYTDGSASEWSFGGRVAHKEVPMYLWAGYEAPTVKILGQPMADADLFSLGLGATRELVEGFSVFMEAGYTFTDISTNESVVDEVAYTWLVNRHGAGGNRNVPVPCAYNPGCYESSYTVDDGLTARIGAEWALSEHISVTGAYKWTYLDQEMFIKKINLEEGAGYWREDETLDLSAFEVGVWYRF